jgi:hypothetical protein
MSLSPVIVKHLARIYATFLNASTDDAVRTLVREVIWPDVTFTASIPQLRAYLMSCGEVGVGSRSDDKLQEELPLICGFRFLQRDSRGEFWYGWEGAFPCVDHAKLFREKREMKVGNDCRMRMEINRNIHCKMWFTGREVQLPYE